MSSGLKIPATSGHFLLKESLDLIFFLYIKL